MKNSSLTDFLSFFSVCLILFSCKQQTASNLNTVNLEPKGRDVPAFNADTAYHFIKKQVGFGPRNPNSTGHRKAKDYLENKLQKYAGKNFVFTQSFTHAGYKSDTLSLTNIIASFRPRHNDRIMLCAHWDTRPRAEEARKQDKRDIPILGADDGGSGVGVLLELARLFNNYPPPIGVDIVLFDGEDYGKQDSLQHYFLGSRYWAEHPPVPGYRPRFAILVDMVGGKEATFPKERYSLNYAKPIVDELWAIAKELSHDNYFIDETGRAIQDDHVVINRKLKIPALNIIHHTSNENDNNSGFPPYWHTHQDNIQIIDKETLHAVGEVLAELIYNRL